MEYGSQGYGFYTTARRRRNLIVAGLIICLIVSLATLISCNNMGASGTFAVSYDPNGATSGVAPQGATTYSSDSEVTVSDNLGDLYKNGNTFSGWNTTSDGSGTSYSPGDTFVMGSANVTLYAQWTAGTKMWEIAGTGNPGANLLADAVGTSVHLFVAGWQLGGLITWGSGVSSTGPYVAGNYADENALLLEYNESGTPVWATVPQSASCQSVFKGVAVDSNENTYAVGYQETGSVNYGGTASITSTTRVGTLVKYNSSGGAMWARSVTNPYLLGAATDSSDNVVIVGQGAILSGPNKNKLFVAAKYNSSGTEIWSQTVSALGEYYGVAIDSQGNIYVAGEQTDNGARTYSTGVTLTGTSSSGISAVLIKYDSTGALQWGKIVAGGSSSVFWSVSVDSSGNVYVSGAQSGTGTYDFGNGVNATGSNAQGNPVLVKYDSSGNALWARTATGATSGADAAFYGSAVDASGDIYAAGNQGGTATYDYGNNVTATATGSGGNAVLVKYDSSGTAQWAQTISGNLFRAVSTDQSDNAYPAGSWSAMVGEYGP